MAGGYEALTEREKQTLRLIVRGHDAKSTARELGLSVHTINERLRDARRKLSVSSSREAARLVLEREGAHPENAADRSLGEAGEPPGTQVRSRRQWRRRTIGVVTMSIGLGLALLVGLTNGASEPAPAATAAGAASEGAARAWLTLVDQSRWEDSWRATGKTFQSQNTVAAWAAASQSARVPLGAVRTRTLLSYDSVPTPPSGGELVKFRTSFANKAEAVETVMLFREAGTLRVVGYYID